MLGSERQGAFCALGHIKERGKHTMKSIKVTLSAWKSKYYPVQAVFTMNKVRYQLVFCDTAEAKRYFRNRFYPVDVTFCEG